MSNGHSSCSSGLRNHCNVAYARARVGKSRYTKEILAAQAIRSTSLHRKPRRREDQKSHSTHSTDHIQREKAPMAMFHSYIIMYINVISLGPSQFPHLRLQSNYIYNIIYLFPVPAALHCPILCSTKAHALQYALEFLLAQWVINPT